MDIVTIDFETYYDKNYSLSKMTTEEYVRSDLFEVIGVAIKVNDHPTDFYSGGNVGQCLKSLDYSDKAILCHNTMFDGAILSWHYGIKPKFWMDTMLMARPNYNVTVGGALKNLATHFGLQAKGTFVNDMKGKRRADMTPQELKDYGEYCIGDVDITYALYNKLKVGFPVSELLVIDQTIRMYTQPVIELDEPLLRSHLKKVQDRKQALLDKLGGGDKAKKTLMSNQMFASLLTKMGADVPMKVSPTTGKETFAFAKTDAGFKALLDHPDPRVQLVTEARLGVKSTIEETRTERLITTGQRGALPIMLKYYGAHTGRFCLTGDTVISVLRNGAIMDILLPELLPEDLVWDGEAFAKHGGLVDQGVREVITYDGVTGTPDHRVYCNEVEGEVELRVAQEQGYTLTAPGTAKDHWADVSDTVAGGAGG